MEVKKITLLEIRRSFKLFRRFNKYILRYWKAELLVLVLGNCSVILSLVNPYIGKNILDKGILAKNTKAFMAFTILIAGIYLISLTISNIHRYIKNYIIRKIKVDLTKDAFRRLRTYSLRYFQEKPTGIHIFRITNDITAASNVINDTLPNIITAVIKLILITAIVIFINWKILFLILIYQFLVLIQINLFIKRIEELIRANLAKSEDVFKRLNEVFSHIYIVKAFGALTQEIRKYFHHLVERIRLEIRETKLNIISNFLATTSNKLFFGIVGFYGSILVINGRMSLGSLGAVMAYISQGAGAYAALLRLGQQIVLNRIALERVSALFDAGSEIKEKNSAKNITFRTGKIEFKDVSFGYKKEKYVLVNMDFCIFPAAHIAIVGASGCGKTTILNLLLRLYDINKGSILLDDCDLRDLKFKSIYSQIAIAAQEPFLWNDSVGNNILYGKEKGTRDEIIYAAEIAQAADFIINLPYGYETIIGEQACWISQGQKQRIAIARALIKRPKILIIDEAMSSLDSQTEDKIVDNIQREFYNSTVIVVSHRLSTVKKMDLVYFLTEPNRMDIGRHEVLLQNQKYRALFASQIEEGVTVNEGAD